MLFMLIFNEMPRDFARREAPAEAPTYWRDWNAYINAMVQAGIVVGGNLLQAPSTGATVSVADGRPQRRYGAADTESPAIGGWFIINVTTLGEALDWAARSPNVGDGSCGHTEVRPLLPPPPRPA